MTAPTAPPTLGIGIIGLGFMGRAHLTAIQQAVAAGEACELVAVCDRNPEHRAGRFGAAGNLALSSAGPLFDPARVAAYENVHALLADPRVHAAIVCTHTESHVEVALACLAAGKHVLVEKPVSLDPAQVVRLERAASDAWRSRGLRVMPGMCMRFWPGWDWLRDRITDRKFGALRSLSLQRLGSTPTWAAHFYADPTRSGGAFGDLHIHDTDFVCWALGAPAAVTTRGSRLHCTTLYTLEDGSTPHVAAEGAWDLTPGAGFRMRYLAVFEHATAEFDLSREPRVVLFDGKGTEPVDVGTGGGTGAGYLPQLRHFLAAIRDFAMPLRATLADAVVVSKTLDAERRSMETGETVRLQ